MTAHAGDKLFLRLLTALGFMAVVLPNALREVAVPLLLLTAFVAAGRIELTGHDLEIFACWLAASCVTIFYLLVGAMRGYTDAIPQVVAVYIVCPALWLLVLRGAFATLTPLAIARGVIVLGVLGALSVYVYYIVFFLSGPDALTWLIATPNITFDSGLPTAAMHVFGSLIFVCGAFFAALELIDNRRQRLLIALCLLGAVMLSGRSALLVSVSIGLVVRFIARRNATQTMGSKSNSPLLWVASSATIIIVATFVTGFDVVRILGATAQKIAEGGGSERIGQALALSSGALDSWLLGAGHGVGVPLIRDEEYPWRYEILPLVTVFRVGLLGAIIYAIPIAAIVTLSARLWSTRRFTLVDQFMLGGFLPIVFSTFTNPYLESFSFQWMLGLPFVHFLLRSRGKPL
jgi:hypothetical protein